MTKRMTNFGIASYIHANQDNAAKDINLLNSKRMGGAASRYEASARRMEQQFQAQAGMSSQQFMKELQEEVKFMEGLFDLLDSRDVKTLLKYKDDKDAIASITKGKKDLEALLNLSEITGYSSLHAMMKSKDAGAQYGGSQISAAQIEKELAQAIADAQEIDTFAIYQQGIASVANANTKDENILTMAVRSVILEEMLGQMKKAKVNIEGTTLFTNQVDFSLDALDKYTIELDNFLKEVKNGKVSSIAKFNKAVNQLVLNIDRQVKGLNVGEFAGALLTKEVADAIYGRVGKAISAEITHMGTQSRTLTAPGVVSGKTFVTRGGGMKELSKAIEHAATQVIGKVQSADYVYNLKYEEGGTVKNAQLGVSKKTANPLSAQRGIGIAGSTSISRIFAMLQNPALANEFLGDTSKGALFFNALIALLDDKYYLPVKKNGEVKLEAQQGKRASTGKALNYIYGDVIDEFVVLAFEALLNPEFTALIDMNGVIIPTPVYYRKMIEKFIMSSNITASSFMRFHYSAGADVINSILTSDGATATQMKGDGSKSRQLINYSAPAAFRNAELRRKLTSTKLISVRSTYMTMSDFKKL